MSTQLYLVDPAPGPTWAPFAGSRPLATLRVGSRTTLDYWRNAAGIDPTAVIGLPHLDGFRDLAGGVSIAVVAEATIAGPAIVGCSDCLPTAALPRSDSYTQLEMRGRPVGWLVPAGAHWPSPADETAATAEISGITLGGAFDLVTAAETLLGQELAERITGVAQVPAGVTVLGDPAHLVIDGATVEPGAVIDVRGGPVVLEANAVVRSDSRLEGPLWIGARSTVLGGAIARSAIGPWCKVRGEVTNTIMLGYANKSHDGFVGHSVIGEWANLGANTVTSNLKNTYGPIRLSSPQGRIETGRTLLGSLIGDHAKTAIGTLLDTGTIIGCGANVFGPIRPPRYVRPFAWGAAGDTVTDRQGFLTTAARVLPRRQVKLDEELTGLLGRIYDALAVEP